MADHRESLRVLYSHDASTAYQEHVRAVEAELDRLSATNAQLSLEKPYEALSLGLVEAIANLRTIVERAQDRQRTVETIAERSLEVQRLDAEARLAEARTQERLLDQRQHSITSATEAIKVLLSNQWTWLALIVIVVLLIGGPSALTALGGILRPGSVPAVE